MEQERKTQNEKANTKNNNAGEAGNADEQNMKQSSEQSKGGPEDIVTYNEGQYQEGTDKPTMSPGSSDAEINSSAKHNNKDENG
jgi:hypothetical protein